MGKAKNLRSRVSSYFINKNSGEKTKLLVSKIGKIRIVSTNSEIESLLLEANFIKRYSPYFNIKLTDGKAYPLIRITIKDKYPKVLIARRIENGSPNGNSLYFGPYPNAGSMRLVLRTIRRIFPFQSVVNHAKKPCLFYHLELCPCPPAFDSKKLQKEYKKTIKNIINFLNGKINTVMSDLIKERDVLSKNENFEEAVRIQKKINAIQILIQPVHKPFEYETNPNLREDLRKKELDSLKKELLAAGTKVKKLKKIECFDVSNTMGKLATGSLVVFVNGEKDKSMYRKFRIEFKKSPNDFAMMEEIIVRRFRHKEWEFPDLIIVDGGKGQISAAVKALKKSGVDIPILGLAKRDEVIITENFKEIRLPKNSDALHFIMRVRDEAHRFAISYHKKLRVRHLTE